MQFHVILARIAAFGTLAGLIASCSGAAAQQPAPSDAPFAPPTVVLVHGAFADSSSWNAVITDLERDGFPVIAAANPLRGLRSDARYLASVLDSVDGPVVLAGHSYGGYTALYHAAVDPRCRFACISGAVCSFGTRRREETGITLFEAVPGLAQMIDTHDVLAAIGPRPARCTQSPAARSTRSAGRPATNRCLTTSRRCCAGSSPGRREGQPDSEASSSRSSSSGVSSSARRRSSSKASASSGWST